MNDIDTSVQKYVSWLVGDVTDAAPEIDAVAHGPAVARGLRARLERGGETVVEVLGRLAADDIPESLLHQVLAECWLAIRDALPARPSFVLFPFGDCADQLIYLVLSLAPDVERKFTSDELEYLTSACARDPRLLRHLLTWASTQPSSAKDVAAPSFAPRSGWTVLAHQYRGLFPKERRHPGYFNWSSRVGKGLARRLVADVDLDNLIEEWWPREVFPLVHLVAPLADLSPELARIAAESRLAIESFLEQASEIEIAVPHSSYDGPLSNVDFVNALRFLSMSTLDRAAPKVGWVVGCMLHTSGKPHSARAVASLLRKKPHEVEGSKTCEVALLWADLQQLVKYQSDPWNNKDEIRGVIARLSLSVKSCPDAWTMSARDILTHRKILGDPIVDLLVLGAANHTPLRAALEKIAHGDPERGLRDRAQGLLARIAGLGTPGEDVRRWLMDNAARAFDGTPLFPNPLTPLAKTWLGSTDLDATLPTAIRQAMVRFSGFANDQGGVAVEEHVTGVLLTELEAAFRGVSLRLAINGKSRAARAISVSHRSTHKTIEEPHWGCDIALLLDADIRPDVRIELAELVQVKKSQMFAAGRSAASQERWRIDVPQLVALMERSQSAGYWLLLSTGDVVCVTARWIHALVRGRDALGQGSVTIGYNDIRHAAVPMEQFLPELFLGTWIGSADEATVTFARGDDVNVRPRHIFEISVVADRE